MSLNHDLLILNLSHKSYKWGKRLRNYRMGHTVSSRMPIWTSKFRTIYQTDSPGKSPTERIIYVSVV